MHGVSLSAVVVATVAMFAVGAFWYMVPLVKFGAKFTILTN